MAPAMTSIMRRPALHWLVSVLLIVMLGPSFAAVGPAGHMEAAGAPPASSPARYVLFIPGVCPDKDPLTVLLDCMGRINAKDRAIGNPAGGTAGFWHADQASGSFSFTPLSLATVRPTAPSTPRPTPSKASTHRQGCSGIKLVGTLSGRKDSQP